MSGRSSRPVNVRCFGVSIGMTASTILRLIGKAFVAIGRSTWTCRCDGKARLSTVLNSQHSLKPQILPGIAGLGTTFFGLVTRNCHLYMPGSMWVSATMVMVTLLPVEFERHFVPYG